MLGDIYVWVRLRLIQLIYLFEGLRGAIFKYFSQNCLRSVRLVGTKQKERRFRQKETDSNEAHHRIHESD